MATTDSKEKKAEGAESETGVEEEDGEAEELGDLPEEIALQLGHGLFSSEQALQDALVLAGVDDLPVVLLRGKPRLVVPSHQHNKFTTKYVNNFEKRSNGK